MKVLIADDDPQMVRALRITLARGYEVVTARPTAGPRSTRPRRQHSDLIVLDLGMLGLTGIEVIEALRGWTQVPVLVVSGRSESWDKVEAPRRGRGRLRHQAVLRRRAAGAHPGAGPGEGPSRADEPVVRSATSPWTSRART